VDPVFKALADSTRRELLDELFAHDGRTLTQLETRFAMTRFGVMKHLKVLEDAGLVVTARHGRQKLHFLNPVPIRHIHDRWMGKYAEPWAAGSGPVEETLDPAGEKVYELYIRATPERLWDAITDPETRARYNFGAAAHSDWTPGATIEVTAPGTGVLGDGVVLEAERPHRLVHTMTARWNDEVPTEGASLVTWETEPVGESCHLTLVHGELNEEVDDEVLGGWPMILSGLKTYLETGDSLPTPGALRHIRPR